jgi:hypothetical protein
MVKIPSSSDKVAVMASVVTFGPGFGGGMGP